jgi:outer membrane immunogenic protein
MSKTLKSVGIAAIVSLAAFPVLSADLSNYEAPPAYNEAPKSSWTGAYVGGHIGAAMPSANPFKGGKGL